MIYDGDLEEGRHFFLRSKIKNDKIMQREAGETEAETIEGLTEPVQVI